MAEVAAREIERWPAGRAAVGLADHAGDHARGDHADGLRRAREQSLGASRRGPPKLPRVRRGAAPDGAPGRARTAPRRQARDAAGRARAGRRAHLRGDPRPPRRARSRRAGRRALTAAPGAPRRRQRHERRGAPRRADDAAGGGARDERHRAGVGARGADPPPGGARPTPRGDRRRRRRLPRRGRQGDAPAAPGDRHRAAPPDRAHGDRRPHAARRRERGALHLPPAPPRGRLRGPARLPARALPREAAGHLHVDPVRRRRAALPRRQLRPVRDEGRAARAGRPPRHPRAPDRSRSGGSGGRSCSPRRAAARSWWSAARQSATRRSLPRAAAASRGAARVLAAAGAGGSTGAPHAAAAQPPAEAPSLDAQQAMGGRGASDADASSLPPLAEAPQPSRQGHAWHKGEAFEYQRCRHGLSGSCPSAGRRRAQVAESSGSKIIAVEASSATSPA